MVKPTRCAVYDDTSELQPLDVEPLATAVYVRTSYPKDGVILTRQMLRDLLTSFDILGVGNADAGGADVE